MKSKKQRLAVADFVSNDGERGVLDAQIAESLISELSAKDSFRLLERKRLKTVLAELQLGETGLISSENAIRIGNLLPVDMILTGTYTKMANYIIINGRFIHVVTGEILFAFERRMTWEGGLVRRDDIQVDPGQGKTTGEPGKNKQPTTDAPKTNDGDGCAAQAAVEKALADLTTEDKVQAAASLAEKTRFSAPCERLHYIVMGTFQRYKKFPDSYRRFLIRTARELDRPSADNRAIEILRYFAADNIIDNEEWLAGVEIAKKSEGYFHNYLRYLLHPDKTPTEQAKQRISQLFELARKGQIGRPVAVKEPVFFIAIMHALRYTDSAEGDNLTAFVVEQYGSILEGAEPREEKKIYDMLESLYLDAEGAHRDIYREAMLRNIKTLGTDRAFPLALRLEEKLADVRRKKDPRSASELKAFNAALASELCASTVSPYPSQAKDRFKYIYRNGIVCSNLPSAQLHAERLFQGEWRDRVEAAEYLSYMMAYAAPAEEALVKCLKNKTAKDKDYHKYCIIALGNIPTKRGDAISLLIETLALIDSYLVDATEKALVRIGSPAVPYLAQNIASQASSYSRARSLDVLAEMGKLAKSALPQLRWVAQHAEEYYIRDKAKSVIDIIEEN